MFGYLIDLMSAYIFENTHKTIIILFLRKNDREMWNVLWSQVSVDQSQYTQSPIGGKRKCKIWISIEIIVLLYCGANLEVQFYGYNSRGIGPTLESLNRAYSASLLYRVYRRSVKFVFADTKCMGWQMFAQTVILYDVYWFPLSQCTFQVVRRETISIHRGTDPVHGSSTAQRKAAGLCNNASGKKTSPWKRRET